MRRCTFCRDEIGAVHWAFDGVSERPVPACRECCERLRLKVWKVETRCRPSSGGRGSGGGRRGARSVPWGASLRACAPVVLAVCGGWRGEIEHSIAVGVAERSLRDHLSGE
jgi:hypothetical protein